jgi:tRNA 2-thiouridine synthesizing protein A
MAEIKVDVIGESCPVPLVETRKALKKAQPGDVIVITGTNPASKKEIPMAAEAMSIEIIGEEETDGVWTVRLRR